MINSLLDKDNIIIYILGLGFYRFDQELFRK